MRRRSVFITLMEYQQLGLQIESVALTRCKREWIDRMRRVSTQNNYFNIKLYLQSILDKAALHIKLIVACKSLTVIAILASVNKIKQYFRFITMYNERNGRIKLNTIKHAKNISNK